MRDIKFRGKRMDNGGWIKGSLIIENPPLQCLPSENPEPNKYLIGKSGFADWNMPRPFPTIEVFPESVGEFSNLKDKNGIEIYEGDIYHMGDTNITYTVVWHDCGLIGKQNGSSSYAGLNHWKDRIEVIGNYYENQ